MSFKRNENPYASLDVGIWTQLKEYDKIWLMTKVPLYYYNNEYMTKEKLEEHHSNGWISKKNLHMLLTSRYKLKQNSVLTYIKYERKFYTTEKYMPNVSFDWADAHQDFFDIICKEKD